MYDYNNLEGSVNKVKNDQEAREGLLPEGRYRVAFLGAKYHSGNNPTKKTWRWELKVRFICDPKNIFNRAERNICYFVSDAKMHIERFPQFVAFLKALGLNLAKGGDVAEDKDILDWLDRAFEQRLGFEVDVANQTKKDPTTGELVTDTKYQTFDIVIESVKPVLKAVKAEIAKQGAQTYEAPEDTAQGEEVTEGEGQEDQGEPAEEVPPPPPPKAAAPAARKPLNPFNKPR